MRVSAVSSDSDLFFSHCEHAAGAYFQYQDLFFAAGPGIEIDEDILAVGTGTADFVAEYLIFAA